MSEQVLYRKYRPQRFDDVVGQEHVVKTLLNAISSDKIAHAYLFCGPRGCGKTTVARLLAKAINCEDKSGPEPCDKCSSCLEIKKGNAMDLVEIDAASHRGIDEIRELREGIRFSPTNLTYKVFILDEAHQLTSGAANALLKVLEDTPSHAVFIFATTEPQKMISTIISRCQRFDFRKIRVPEMVKRMKKISKKEKRKIDEEALKLIAAAAGGALRDAESLLSQVFAFTSEDEPIKKENIRGLLGTVEKIAIGEFVDFLLNKDGGGAIEKMDQVLSQGVDPEDFYNNLIHYLREMMILKIVKERKGALIESLMASFTKEEIEKIEEQAKRPDEEEIREIIDVFLEAGRKMNYSPIPELPLEAAIAETVEELKKEGK